MAAPNQTDLPTGPWVNICPGCVINSTSTTTSYQSSTVLDRGTRYFWQVKAQGSSGEPGTWSGQWSFTTDPTLPPPAIYNPVNGATNTPTTPSFSWSSVSGATSYRIMAATSQAALPSGPFETTCTGCVINATVATTSMQVPWPSTRFIIGKSEQKEAQEATGPPNRNLLP